MTQRLIQYLLTMCSVVGLILSGYLILLSFQAEAVCNPNEIFSCDTVLNSEYSKVMGVPVAAFGFVWFSVATALSSASFVRLIRPGLFLSWSIIGLLGIASLVYVEVFLIGAVCLLCTATHILGGAIFGLSILYWKNASQTSRRV